MSRDFIPHPQCTVMSGDCFHEGKCLMECRPKVVELSTYTDPVAECYRRIRDACLMDDVSQSTKVAALELVKAELLRDMLAAMSDA